MADEWIKMRTGLGAQPEVMTLARVLRLERLAVVGRLWAFWAWADGVTSDGRLPGVDLADIDRLVERKGFAAALLALPAREIDEDGEHGGWLARDAEGLFIPNFARHNGRSAKKRAMDQRRQQAARGRESGVARARHARGVTEKGHGRDTRHAESVTESGQPRDKKRTPEKKERREEVIVASATMTTPKPPTQRNAEPSGGPGGSSSSPRAAGCDGGKTGAAAVWDGRFTSADSEALIAAWNATPGYRATRIDLAGLASVYAEIAVSDLAPPEARAEPVAWLLGRVQAFLRSHTATTEGGKFKGKLGNWLRPRDHRPCRAFETDESWADIGADGSVGGSGVATAPPGCSVEDILAVVERAGKGGAR